MNAVITAAIRGGIVIVIVGNVLLMDMSLPLIMKLKKNCTGLAVQILRSDVCLSCLVV